MPNLADEYGLNHSNLHKILTRRSGASWPQDFNCDDLNIHESLETTIPRLLSEETIEAIRRKAEANRTYQHGQLKNQYLLSHMIFCGHCNYAMFGQTNHGVHRRYRHAHTKRVATCSGPNTKKWIPADVLEDDVIKQLFECFGNPKAVQKAIEDATPNLEKINEARQRQERAEGSLAKIKVGREKILLLLRNDKITYEESRKATRRPTATGNPPAGGVGPSTGQPPKHPNPGFDQEGIQGGRC